MTTLEDLELCRYFNVGMVVWVLFADRENEYRQNWTPAKVVEAAGYSAYVENKRYNVSQWIDLRHHDVMTRKVKEAAK